MSVFATLRRSVGLSSQKSLTDTNGNANASGSSSPKKQSATPDKGPVHGYLVLESSNGIETERYPLQKRVTTIGRLHQGDIRIYGETVSRLHCQINVAEDGKISLQVFNVRGLKLNQQKIQSIVNTSDKDKVIPLEGSDLIEIFTHRFRVEYVARDEQGRAIVPKNARLGRKSLRMSLVRAATRQTDTNAPLKESQAALEEAEEDLEHDNKEKVKTTQTLPFTEQDKENAPMKGRRSFTLNTPNRSSIHNGPWETEPRKKKVKRLSMSPIKKAPLISTSTAGSSKDLDSSIVVMEEVNDSEMEEDVLQPQSVEVEYEPIEEQEPIATPLKDTPIPSQRLTQSSSPKKPSKKTKRRSSFFGRAGIFAGLNLGFYPEERRDNEEEKAVESDLKEAVPLTPPTSPSKIQKYATPEPPLDSYGMPRLPRSMSSPSGLHYGSPGKRRVISLRTATLIKTGQQTFEQQKLLSPPSSPTKTISSPSLFAAMGSTSPSKKAAAGQIPLPDSDDEEDADEVDRSLSSFLDDEDVVEEEEEEEKSLPPQPLFNTSKPRTHTGPRKSHGLPSSHTVDKKTKAKGKGRISMPGTLLSVSLVGANTEKTVEDWRKEWQENGNAGDKKQSKSVEVALDEAFNDAQDDDTDEEKIVEAGEQVLEEKAGHGKDTVSHQEAASPEKEARSPLKMLRHMVRDNVDMIALLDEIAGVDVAQDAEALEDKDESQDVIVPEPRSTRVLPQELLVGSDARLSRRASELPQRKGRRRSSVASKTVPAKSRKSAGAVLHTKEVEDVAISVSNTASIDVEVVDVAMDVPEQDVIIGTNEVEEKQPEEKLQEVKAEQVLLIAEPILAEPVMELPHESQEMVVMKEEIVVKRSPRKRAVEPVKTQIPVAARVTRGATTINVGIERAASSSPQKKSTVRGKNALSSVKGYSEEIDSDDLHSSRLIMEPSSPIKRTKRAAKEQAETKIRNVLVKKPSIAVMRDARSLSEAGQSKPSMNPSDEIRARMSKPRKVKEPIVHSEPITRTTRSRAAALKK